MLSRVVGLVFEYATLNGGERSMLAVLDWLKQNDPRFEFVAIAPSIGELNDALNDRQIPVICWSDVASGEAGRSSKPTEDQLASIVRCQNFCLLHANSLAMGRLTGRVAENTGVPTTTHLRDIIKLSNAAIEDLNRNRSLVAVSNATRDFHVTQGVSANRTVVIHNGVDLDQFQPRIRSNKLAIELGLADYPVRIIASIGQIGLRKGQDTLAAAAPAILAQVPDAHFVIIGVRTSQKTESIEFERAISERFQDQELGDRLHLLGYRSDVAELLNEIDLLVHPANQEPFGRVLLEASASAVPIVATDVGGTSEMIVDGVTGLLVPPRDPQALAMAVIELLKNSSKANSVRLAARERMCCDFPVSLSAQRLADLWSQVLDNEDRRC